MDIQAATDLLRALTASIESKSPSSHSLVSPGVMSRAKHIAEKEALRRFKRTQDFEMSLIVGAEAYARETQRYRPLSFIHEIDEGVEQAWAAERREG